MGKSHCPSSSYTSIPSTPLSSSNPLAPIEMTTPPSQIITNLLVEARAQLIDISRVIDALNIVHDSNQELLWPSNWLREKSLRSSWDGWYPQAGMVGNIVHRWIPGSLEPSKFISGDKVLLLLQVDDYIVPYWKMEYKCLNRMSMKCVFEFIMLFLFCFFSPHCLCRTKSRPKIKD